MTNRFSLPLRAFCTALLFAAAPNAIAQGETAQDASEVGADDALQPVAEAKIEIRDVDPALWVIRDEDTTIYLFGTVHVLRPGLGWFDDAVKQAFDASDTLVLEVAETSDGNAQAVFGQYALAQDGIKLRSRLSAEALSDYNQAMKKTGLLAAGFDPLDPWAVAVTLQMVGLSTAGYDVSSGVETQLEAAAKARSMKIDQVETMDDQLRAFDNISMPVQIKYLNQTTANIDAATDELDKLVDAWANGETELMGQMITAGFQDAELYNALLTRRNANWAQWIDRRMDQPGTVFMAVGAGHLAGQISLQNLVKAYGLEAERISY